MATYRRVTWPACSSNLLCVKDKVRNMMESSRWSDIFRVWSNRGFTITIQLKNLNSAVFLSTSVRANTSSFNMTTAAPERAQLFKRVTVCLQMLIASLPLWPLKWLFPRVKIHTGDNGLAGQSSLSKNWIRFRTFIYPQFVLPIALFVD